MMILINPVCSASIDSPYLGSETPNLVPDARLDARSRAANRHRAQAEGDPEKLARSLYVHRLCLEAAEP